MDLLTRSNAGFSQIVRVFAAAAAATQACVLGGCASGYVLHSKEPKLLNTLVPGVFSAFETAQLPGGGKVVLLYDRAERVVYEDVQDDGSVWLHYAINVKNSGPSSVEVDLRETHLLGEDIDVEVPEAESGTGKIEVTASVVDGSKEKKKKSPPGKKDGDPAEGSGGAAKSEKMVTIKETRRFFAQCRDSKSKANVAPNGYVKIPCSFRIARGAISKYGGSSEPMQLVVPMKGLPKGVDDLRLKVWLWRVK